MQDQDQNSIRCQRHAHFPETHFVPMCLRAGTRVAPWSLVSAYEQLISPETLLSRHTTAEVSGDLPFLALKIDNIQMKASIVAALEHLNGAVTLDGNRVVALGRAASIVAMP
jgi:hypothetical protein